MSNNDNIVRILCLPRLVPSNSIVKYKNSNFVDIRIEISNDAIQKEHKAMDANFVFDEQESALFTKYDADEHADDNGIVHIPREQYKIIWHARLFIKQEAQCPMEEIEKPLRGKIEDVISEFHKQWLEIDQSMLIELITFANKWGIKPMLDLTCANVASMIKGKSPEQIREYAKCN